MSKDSKSNSGSLNQKSNTSFRSVEEIEAAYDEQYAPEDLARALDYEAGLGPEHDAPRSLFDRSFKSSRTASTVDPLSPFQDDDIFQRLLDPDELDEDAKNELCSYVFKNVLGTNFVFHGPFGKTLGRFECWLNMGRG